ncbi:MAG: ZIP family metal transporter [Candidatus Jorgensenbacteria bacterium]|nr:ZIP family metal transporter [Candidatus Jorgensenbacteria bacterium]
MTTATLPAFLSVIIVSLLSLIGVFTLSLSNAALRKVIFFGVSLSVGALFGDTFIHLIPGAFEKIKNTELISVLILFGIILFFVLEKFLAWRHTHAEEHQIITTPPTHGVSPLGPMVLASDAVHNFIDGIAIGASYVAGFEIGIATTIAIILHEIPHEIGNFSILLHAGFGKTRALFLNFLSALAAILGTALALAAGNSFENLTSIVMAITAGSFIYIAGSDLVPELHKTPEPGKSALQLISIIVGILLMLAIQLVE